MFFTFPFPSTAATTSSSFFGSLDNFLPVETVRAEFRGLENLLSLPLLSGGLPPVSHHVSHSRLRKLSSDRGMLQHTHTQTLTHTTQPDTHSYPSSSVAVGGGECGGSRHEIPVRLSRSHFRSPNHSRSLSLALTHTLTPAGGGNHFNPILASRAQTK